MLLTKRSVRLVLPTAFDPSTEIFFWSTREVLLSPRFRRHDAEGVGSGSILGAAAGDNFFRGHSVPDERTAGELGAFSCEQDVRLLDAGVIGMPGDHDLPAQAVLPREGGDLLHSRRDSLHDFLRLKRESGNAG